MFYFCLFIIFIYFKNCCFFIPLQWSSSLAKEWKCPILALECISCHLRSCTILNLEDWDSSDLGFAKYILQNAKLLQDMEIKATTCCSNDCCSNGLLMQNSQIIEELSSCPRISPGCKLSFTQEYLLELSVCVN